eukprot:CAMPEP_0180803932 /NCGR_PEP_ID=MMETSP1038_2-20121128/61181_1 /TAXON_ID=632150 /ORGANISM="Azadinium spinosum, Strain 3D9" /LENGTH=84 /DNA_ID=CAMNT_0022844321 /DNA_START=69 /DNA_END=320 /DNA_ORIENTATION=-
MAGKAPPPKAGIKPSPWRASATGLWTRAHRRISSRLDADSFAQAPCLKSSAISPPLALEAANARALQPSLETESGLRCPGSAPC